MKNKKIVIPLVLIFLFGLSLRLVYVLFIPQIDVNRGDSGRYTATTANLVGGKGYSYDDGKPDVFLAPGYPFFLALIYKICGVHNYSAVRVTQSILGALAILLIYFLAEIVFNRKAGIISALIASIYPGFIGYSGLLLPQLLVMFLILLFLFILLRLPMNFCSGCLLGIIAGYSSLIRPELTLFWFIFCVIIFLAKKEERRRLKFVAVIFIFMSTVILPWTARNYKVFGRPILISIHYGDLLWYSTWKGEWLEYRSEPPYTTIAEGLGPVDAANAYLKAGILNIKEHPFIYVKMCIKRFFRLWLSGHSNIFSCMARSLQDYLSEKKYLVFFAKIAMLALNSILILIGFFSGISAYKNINNGLFLYSMIYPVLFFSIFHFFIFSTPRYAIPAMPFVIIFASFTIMSLLETKRAV